MHLDFKSRDLKAYFYVFHKMITDLIICFYAVNHFPWYAPFMMVQTCLGGLCFCCCYEISALAL